MPSAPIEAPRPTGSSAAIRSTAAIFGAPVIEPPGKVRSAGSRRGRRPRAAFPPRSRRGASTPASWRVGHQLRPAHRAGLAHAREVVALEVDDHRVLGRVLLRPGRSAASPSGRVPLIGRVAIVRPRRERKSSGEAETIDQPSPRAGRGGAGAAARAARRARPGFRGRAPRGAGRGSPGTRRRARSRCGRPRPRPGSRRRPRRFSHDPIRNRESDSLLLCRFRRGVLLAHTTGQEGATGHGSGGGGAADAPDRLREAVAEEEVGDKAPTRPHSSLGEVRLERRRTRPRVGRARARAYATSTARRRPPRRRRRRRPRHRSSSSRGTSRCSSTREGEAFGSVAGRAASSPRPPRRRRPSRRLPVRPRFRPCLGVVLLAAERHANGLRPLTPGPEQDRPELLALLSVQHLGGGNAATRAHLAEPRGGLGGDRGRAGPPRHAAAGRL